MNGLRQPVAESGTSGHPTPRLDSRLEETTRETETNNNMLQKDSVYYHEDDPIPSSRPLLIFNHNPKAGGGSILDVLKGFKTRVLSCHKSPRKADRYGSGCPKAVWKEAFVGAGGVDSAFLHFREDARTTKFDRHHGFVIGSIREPCAQYLSLWSWGSLGNGKFRKQEVTDAKLYGTSPPYFNTTADRERFAAWMQHPGVRGIVGNRVTASYGNSVLDSVDCWVFVEDFRRTLLGCLQRYQDQGGWVDWEAPIVAELLHQTQTDEAADEDEAAAIVAYKDEKHFRTLAVRKDDPLGDPRTSHHGKCGTMFDEATARNVREGPESMVYELFGYEGCCRPGTEFAAPRTKAALAGGSHYHHHASNSSTIQPNQPLGSGTDHVRVPIQATKTRGPSIDASSAKVAVLVTMAAVFLLYTYRCLSKPPRNHNNTVRS